MDWKVFLAFAGWSLAIVQFILNFKETKNKNQAELIEKTLSYFGKGPQQRAIVISLIEGIWLKRKANLDIMLPVLVSQAQYLLTTAESSSPEERNLIRILFLIEKCLPYSLNSISEMAEISEAIMDGARSNTGVELGSSTLKYWYVTFNPTGEELWDVEIESNLE